MTLITKIIPSSNNPFIKEATDLALKHKDLFSPPKLAPSISDGWCRTLVDPHLSPSELSLFLTEQNALEMLGITQVRILTNNDLRRGWCVDIDLSNQSHSLNWVQGGQVLSSSLVRPVFKGKGVYYVSK